MGIHTWDGYFEYENVYCCNPDCEFHYHVLFEHFRCKIDKEQEPKEEKNER